MTGIGHNSGEAAKKPKAGGPVSADRLKSFVKRVQKLEEEIASLGEDRKDIYSELKGVGYDAKTVRWLVAELKIEQAERDERDALRDTYAHALGVFA